MKPVCEQEVDRVLRCGKSANAHLKPLSFKTASGVLYDAVLRFQVNLETYMKEAHVLSDIQLG